MPTALALHPVFAARVGVAISQPVPATDALDRAAVRRATSVASTTERRLVSCPPGFQ